MDHPHAATAATAGRLDDDGVADVAGDPQDLRLVVAQRAIRTGHAGHAGFLHRPDGRHLVAHQADGFRLGTDEDESALLDPFGEIGVFGQEAITGMNRHRVGHLGGADDRRHVQVASGGGRRTDANGFVGQADVLEVAIHGGMRGHGADAQLPAGAQNA